MRISQLPWAQIHSRIEREVGVVLFTVLVFTDGGARMERVYSSHPVEYPVGGAKDVATQVAADWIAVSRDSGQTFFGPGPADLDRIFGDAELIRSLGCGSIVNIPVPDATGRTGATVSLCAPAGTYTPELIARAAEIIADATHPASEQTGRNTGAHTEGAR